MLLILLTSALVYCQRIARGYALSLSWFLSKRENEVGKRLDPRSLREDS